MKIIRLCSGLLLSALIFFVLLTRAEALSIYRQEVSKEAIWSCLKTGGQLNDRSLQEVSFKVLFLDSIVIDPLSCSCSDGSQQSLLEMEIGGWAGCRLVSAKQIARITIFYLKILFYRFYYFLILLFIFFELYWAKRQLKSKKITFKQLLLIFGLAFLFVVSLLIWFYGISKEQPPDLIIKVYFRPYEFVYESLINSGYERGSNDLFLISSISFFMISTIFNFLVLLFPWLLINEVKRIKK
ncbi:MAG: hypothetical protein ABIB61_04375 [Candidatus Shapirobacteria bacterium]